MKRILVLNYEFIFLGGVSYEIVRGYVTLGHKVSVMGFRGLDKCDVYCVPCFL